VNRFAVGGEGGWDAITYDADGGRLFVSRSSRVLVVSADDGTVSAEIPDTNGVHAIALASGLGKGFTSDGKANTVTVFDLSTLAVRNRISLHGENPDAILYDTASARIWVFNAKSNSIDIIDPDAETVESSLTLPSNPEFAVSDGKGHIYVNLEDSGELATIDTVRKKLLRTEKLRGCEGPTGIAFEPTMQLVFSTCQNQRMTVFDVRSKKATAFLPIGDKPDGAAYDVLHHRLYASNGGGTLSIFEVLGRDRFRHVAELPTQKSARTLTIDSEHQRVFLPAAEFDAPPAATPETPKPRGALKAGSFSILFVRG
jgi:DNA-binding beta-propeller fold protein YncE